MFDFEINKIILLYGKYDYYLVDFNKTLSSSSKANIQSYDLVKLDLLNGSSAIYLDFDVMFL